jgi:UDP-glucose 4-epimerase
LTDLRTDAERVVRRYIPDYHAQYVRRGWKMFGHIDRVYVNEKARKELGWQPRYDFKFLIDRLCTDEEISSPLAQLIGSKGYHAKSPVGGPYPVK